MNRFDKPHPIFPRKMISPTAAWSMGLAGILLATTSGCQLVGGLEDLKLAGDGGSGGIGGNGGSGAGDSNSSANSSSSSSGAPIMGDVSCDMTTCPIGPESACCSDHYHTNSAPFVECVMGPPGNDGCNTAGGANGYETRIKCQLPTHCPMGTVCCGNLETIAVVTWYTTLSCVTSCSWPDTIICDPMGAGTECPMVLENGKMRQTTCSASDILPAGYFVCK